MNRIKELRNELRLTQQELADKVGISRAVISTYESNINDIPQSNLIKLSRFFGVTIDYLICNSDEEGIVINNELSDFENNLINELRNLSDKDKMLILKFIVFLNN